jgi:hypothetical protein
MHQAAKWRIKFSLAVNSAGEVDPKMHCENLWANTPFSFHLEVGILDNKTKTHFLSFPFEINLLFMMPQSTRAYLHQETRLEVEIFVVENER